jgi:hypothetical protein
VTPSKLFLASPGPILLPAGNTSFWLKMIVTGAESPGTSGAVPK